MCSPKNSAYKYIRIQFVALLAVSFAALLSPRAFAAVSQTKIPTFVDYGSLMYTVQNSDDYRWTHRMPGNLAGYNEADFSEYSKFNFTLGAPPASVVIEGEWRYFGEPPDGVKLEVWDQSAGAWVNETGVSITAADAAWTLNVTSYISTAADVNNIKIRILGYDATSNPSDVEIDVLRVNVNSGSIIRYPEGGSTSVIAIQYSDNIWLPWLADITTSYQESLYQEFSNLGFTMPAGSVMGSVQITYEWQWGRLQTGATLNVASLRVWEYDTLGWSSQPLTVPPMDTDGAAVINVASYINTSTDINNLKFRFHAEKNGNRVVGARPDFVSVTAKRKIIASDVAVYGPGAVTFYAGETDKLALDFKVPDNDGVSDTLNSLFVQNAGTATNTTDISQLKLYLDAGATGFQGPPTDTLVGTFTWNAGSSQWELNALTTTIPIGGLRLFVTANMAANPTDARTVQMRIPANGITVASTYGGPTDAAITNSSTQTIDGMIAAQVTNTGAPAATFYAGDTDKLVMDFTVPLNGAAADTLSGLRVSNAGTAATTTISMMKAWAENGVTPGFQAAQDTYLGQLAWNAPLSRWEKTDMALAFSSAQRVYVTVNLSANPTDAKTMQMRLIQGGADSTAGIFVASGNDGPLDAAVTNAGTQTVDGMTAAQITNTGAATATFYANETNKLVMNFVLPPNGATADTLTGLRVQNTGTAVDAADIAAVRFWADRNSNGTFEPAGADAPALATATWNAGGWWEALALSETIPSGSKRFFVSANIASNPTALRTIRMALKLGGADGTAGAVVASGNDGPLDAQVVNANTQTIKKRLNVSGVSQTGPNVSAGSTNNTMLQLNATSLNGTVQISTVNVDLLGTAQDSDIQNAKLWHDVNNDGLWDGGDAQLSSAKTFAGGTLTFDLVNFNVIAGTPESMVVTYDISGAAVTGRTAGVTLANNTYVTTSAPAGEDVAFASSPLSSGAPLIGTTLSLTGYDKAPGEMLQGATDELMEQVKLESSFGTITVSTIKVMLSGSATASDISAVKLYDDVNNDGALDGGDTLLDTRTFAGAPAYATFTVSYNVAAGTPEYLLITYDVDAAAVPGNQAGAAIQSAAHVTTTGPENVYFTNSMQSSNTPIGQSLFNVIGADAAPATVQVAQTGVKILHVTINASSGSITMTSLKINRTGTSADSDIAAAKLYDDTNDDDALDGGDILLSTKTFSGGTLTFNALTYLVTNPVAEHLHVVFDISPTAVTGNTAGARIVDKTYVTLQPPGVVSPFAQIDSGTPQIANTLSGSGTDRAAALTDVTKGQNNVVFEQLTLDAAAGTINVTGVKVDRTGTGADADIAAAKLFHDVNNNGTYEGGTDTQLGADKTFSGGTLTFNGFSFPVASGTTENLIVLYSISAGATQGVTVGGSIVDSTYITTNPAAGVTVSLSGAPLSSTNVAIKNPAALTSSFQSVTTPVNTNQTFAVTLTVTNAANSSQANGAAPNPTDLTKIYTGGAAVTKMSGPTPASANIPGGGSQDFAYQFRADLPGTVQFEGYSQGTESNLGTTVTSSTVQSAVVTINNQVNPLWQFSDGGTTLAFNEGGQVEWDCPSGSPVTTYYVGNGNGKFYAINMTTGAKRWSYTAAAAINSVPYVEYETCNIYFGDSNGNFHAIHDNGGSASNVWGPLALSPGSAIKAAPILDLVNGETRVYIPSMNGTFYCRDTADGTTCNSTAWADSAMGAAVSSSPALSADNYFWVPTEGGTVKKVDKTNGAVAVTYSGYGAFKASPFTFPRDLSNYSLGNWMFVGDESNKFYRIDTWQAAGSEKAWTFSPSSPVAVQQFRTGAWFNKGFVLPGNVSVYVGNDNGCLYSLDYTNGTQKWKYPAGASCLTYPITSRTLFYNDIIYFGTSSGAFYAVRDDTTSATPLTGWPYSAAGAIKAVSADAYDTNRVMAVSADGRVYAFPLQ